jgi:hypothetical protein
MQAEAMTQQPPSLKDILSQVSALQGQLTALQQVNQNLQNQLNAIQNAPPQPADGAGAGAGVALPPPLLGGADTTAFSLTPIITNHKGLIDYSSKLGQSINKKGCKKLTEDEGFQMTPSNTACLDFHKLLQHHGVEPGRNGNHQVSKPARHHQQHRQELQADR